MNFSGKKILITGASSDFGESLAIHFAKMGCELFLTARTKDKAELVAEIVRKCVIGVNVHCYGVDLRYPNQIVALLVALLKDTLRMDILINNAGHWLQGEFQLADDADVFQAINSTFSGSVLMTKYVVPLLAQSTIAHIINIASLSAQANTEEPAHEAYSAAKFALGQFSYHIRQSIKGSGIRVTTIFPPKFTNTSPLNPEQWNKQLDANGENYVTARNVFEAIIFSLSQDGICCLDEMYISNNR